MSWWPGSGSRRANARRHWPRWRRSAKETHTKDDGCILYALQLDPADESRAFMIEKWESTEALQAHGGSDHIRAAGESGTLAGAPKVTVLQQANFGDATKGTL